MANRDHFDHVVP